MSLRDDLRAAESEAEREAVRDQMRAAYAEMGRLAQAQRNSMVAEVAGAYGIDDPQRLRALTRDLEAVASSPFFRMQGRRGRGASRGAEDAPREDAPPTR